MSERPQHNPEYFLTFQSDIEGVALPIQFNYPFHYTPHEIALIAAKELQDYLQTQTDWQHDFGMERGKDGLIIGKMFGVLVVKNAQGQMGYLCGVSGRLAGQNLHDKFVPPVFDILTEEGFFRKGEAIITEINRRIHTLEKQPHFLAAKNTLDEAMQQAAEELDACTLRNQQQKENRQVKRLHLTVEYSGSALEEQIKKLNNESINDHYQLKQLRKQWLAEEERLKGDVALLQAEIDALKEERKNRSAALQDAIFDAFYFVNRSLEKRSVGDIFKYTPEGRPTAGAGECAAPKLLQYAFLNHLEPIALAEFWWGQSPRTEVRIHGHYYPACKGKCEPILGHMLQGIAMDENPMLKNRAEGKDLTVVWEDEHIVIINKPHEFLSVPGKLVEDSVLTRLSKRYPEATGPLVVHRLDMSTSGLLIAAKTMDIFKELQRQFAEREVKKRYVALLEGTIEENAGWIDLPLRVDLDDRPRQRVCYEHGKPAQTRWKVIERKGGRTKVYFFPVTGRTHQLRVHAAHSLGLNIPIVGDDLYGQRSERLHLHAERIEFRHPVSGKTIAVEVSAEF